MPGLADNYKSRWAGDDTSGLQQRRWTRSRQGKKERLGRSTSQSRRWVQNIKIATLVPWIFSLLSIKSVVVAAHCAEEHASNNHAIYSHSYRSEEAFITGTVPTTPVYIFSQTQNPVLETTPIDSNIGAPLVPNHCLKEVDFNTGVEVDNTPKLHTVNTSAPHIILPLAECSASSRCSTRAPSAHSSALNPALDGLPNMHTVSTASSSAGDMHVGASSCYPTNSLYTFLNDLYSI